MLLTFAIYYFHKTFKISETGLETYQETCKYHESGLIEIDASRLP